MLKCTYLPYLTRQLTLKATVASIIQQLPAWVKACQKQAKDDMTTLSEAPRPPWSSTSGAGQQQHLLLLLPYEPSVHDASKDIRHASRHHWLPKHHS
jgi:hypothetical protein